MRHRWWIFFPLIMSYIPAAGAAELRILPADFIVLNATNADKHYSDLLVHTIAIATKDGETQTLKSLRVEIMSKGEVLLARQLAIGEIVGGTQYLGGAPFPEYVAGQVLNGKGIEGLFGRQVSLASSPTMSPSQVLLAMRLHFSVGFQPDAVRVSATLSGTGGSSTATASVPVRSHVSAITYRAPLEGQWLVQAIPGVQSHHRFNPSTEFAIDFFKVGPDGHVLHGDPLDAQNFYGFGAPVLASARGSVVSVIADQKQDRAALLHKPGESDKDFRARVEAVHMTTMRKNFRAANAGNLITIRHEKDGIVEYSSYGHLKSGSVRVKSGDEVTQGQIIGEVGDTGDSAAVHLHFQINSGPDAFTSKSLPVSFSNLHDIDGNDEMGLLMTTEAEKSRL